MRRRLSIALAVAILFLASMALVVHVPGNAIAQGITNFSNVVVTGDFVAGDDVIAGGDVSVGAVNLWGRQTPIAVGMTGYITPTGSYQPLTAAGVVGTSNIATNTLTVGTVLLLINESANAITISDTAELLLGGNRALGQNDTLLLLHTGTNWVEISTTNN